MNLYRIHYAWKRGGASSSNIKYYEDEGAFLVDLLDHHLDVMAHENRRNWVTYMNVRHWIKRRDRKDDLQETTRIIAAERVSNDEWVPVEYEVIEPAIRLKESKNA